MKDFLYVSEGQYRQNGSIGKILAHDSIPGHLDVYTDEHRDEFVVQVRNHFGDYSKSVGVCLSNGSISVKELTDEAAIYLLEAGEKAAKDLAWPAQGITDEVLPCLHEVAKAICTAWENGLMMGGEFVIPRK